MKIENWNGYNIRFIEINNEWWAVAGDIAKAMGFSKATDALRKMKPCYKGVYKVHTLGGEQEMIVLNEKGMYRLIMRSNKKEAEDFQDFVYQILKELRQASGLQGFEIFRQLDKQHQKEQMAKLKANLKNPVRVDFIKANTITNKAISNKYGHAKMLKKEDMTPQMLVEREEVLEDTVELMGVSNKFNLPISVSQTIYKKFS